MRTCHSDCESLLARSLGNQEHAIAGRAAADGEGTSLLLGGEEGEERVVVAGGGREARVPHRPLRRQLLELHP